MTIDAFAQSILILQQTVATNMHGLVVEQFVVLGSSVRDRHSVQACGSALSLRHLATVSTTTKRSLSSTLGLVQFVQPRVSVLSAESRLLLVQDVVREARKPLVRSSLALSQVVSASLAKGVYSTLAVGHSVSLTVKKNLSVTSVLTLHSGVSAYKPSKYWTSSDITVEAP